MMNLKAGLEKRLKALEAIAKPKMISTLADFVMWAASDSDEEVESLRKLKALLKKRIRLKPISNLSFR